VWWGVLLYTTFEVPPFSHYEPFPAVVTLSEATLQAILCNFIRRCSCSYLVKRPSKLMSIQDLFQSYLEVIISVGQMGGIWWLWKHGYVMFQQIFVNQIRSMCGQTVVVQNPISCLPQLQVFPVDSVSRQQRMSLYIVLLTVWPSGIYYLKYTSNITLPFDLLVRKVCFFGEVGHFQYHDCHLVCGS